MNAPDYRTLLALLDSAKQLLTRNAGDLSPADLRIRCLVNITGKETQRALLELNASVRPAPTKSEAENDNKEKPASPRAERTRSDAVSVH